MWKRGDYESKSGTIGNDRKRRSPQEIEKEMDDNRYAIIKEIQGYEQKEKQINQIEIFAWAKRTLKTKLLINHINKMRLYEKQTALND